MLSLMPPDLRGEWRQTGKVTIGPYTVIRPKNNGRKRPYLFYDHPRLGRYEVCIDVKRFSGVKEDLGASVVARALLGDPELEYVARNYSI